MGKNAYGHIPQNDRAVRAEALKLSARQRGRVRKQLEDYLARTGLNPRDFAQRINYSQPSLYLFLKDEYHQVSGNAAHICKAITSFIAAHPIAPMTETFGVLYNTANVRTMREVFQKLLRKPVAYMVYAPPGSEKTFALKHLVAELNRTELSRNCAGRRGYYVYARVKMQPTQVLKAVAMACGVSSIGDGLRIACNLGFEFQGRRVLLVVDEAQYLSLDCLNALRGLLDEPPYFSLLLAGSHHLKVTFDRFSSVLSQWNSRIIEKVSLPGVERAEAEAIVQRELDDQLRLMTPDKAAKKIKLLVDRAMDSDAFELDGKGQPRSYINIRSLTNVIDDLKMNPRVVQSEAGAVRNE